MKEPSGNMKKEAREMKKGKKFMLSTYCRMPKAY